MVAGARPDHHLLGSLAGPSTTISFALCSAMVTIGPSGLRPPYLVSGRQ
jgi:hypothetical protein